MQGPRFLDDTIPPPEPFFLVQAWEGWTSKPYWLLRLVLLLCIVFLLLWLVHQRRGKISRSNDLGTTHAWLRLHAQLSGWR